MSAHSQSNGEEPPVVVRDRRRIDPQTGAVRTPDPSASAPPAANLTAAGDTGDLQAQLAERTGDLQRITAEYANYRRRVERDREAVVTAARATVVNELLPVLDDIERAAAHGDLTGAFKAVADKLTGTLGKIGLTPFGADGDAFDPAVHQAVQHSTSPDVDGPTVTAVLRRGYQLGDRLLRTAMVAVTDHEPAAAASNEGLPTEGPSTDGSLGEDAPFAAGPAVDHTPIHREQG